MNCTECANHLGESVTYVSGGHGEQPYAGTIMAVQFPLVVVRLLDGTLRQVNPHCLVLESVSGY